MRRQAVSVTVVLALVSGILGAPTPSLGASPQHQTSGTFLAERLELRNVVGTVKISIHDGPKLRVTAYGNGERVGRLLMETRGPVLVVDDRSQAGRIQNSVHVEGNVVIVSNGGSSTQIIGGVPGKSGTTGKLHLDIAVPRKTDVSIDSFVGDLQAGDIEGRFRLDMRAGTARLRRVHAARLRINGGGDIIAERVDGPLDVSIAGSGAVTVKSGAISRLSIAVEGSATVRVGGMARHADVSVDGVADIHVGHVETRPFVRMNGAGSVTFGNW